MKNLNNSISRARAIIDESKKKNNNEVRASCVLFFFFNHNHTLLSAPNYAIVAGDCGIINHRRRHYILCVLVDFRAYFST